MKKKVKRFMYAILLIALILLLNVIFWGTNKAYYRSLQTELDISSKTNISEEGLNRITEKLIKYMQLQEDDIYIVEKINNQEQVVFNQKEVDHMKDVKNLFMAAYGTSFVILVIFIFRLIMLFKKNNIGFFYDEIKLGLIISLSIFIIAFLIFVIDFQAFWKVFHEVLFSNDLYLLNPETDVLIQLMPLKFFVKISTRIAFSFLATNILLLLIVRFGVEKNGKENRSRYS